MASKSWVDNDKVAFRCNDGAWEIPEIECKRKFLKAVMIACMPPNSPKIIFKNALRRPTPKTQCPNIFPVAEFTSIQAP
jgi:hypothetical protein